MAFKLSKASDVAHKRITGLIFGESGVGKTSLVKTLPASSDEKVFYIAADPGQLVFRDRGFIVAEAPNGEWNEGVMIEIYNHLKENQSAYEWIIVDGLDELGEAVLRSKLKVLKDGRKAYGEMGDFMSVWAKGIRDLKGSSVLQITHIDRLTEDTGAVEFVPSFPGKSVAGQLNDWFDLVLCMRFVRTETKVDRLLQCNREADTRYRVKDRSSVLLNFEEPDLGKIFAKIHEAGIETRDEVVVPQFTVEQLSKLIEEKGLSRKAVVEKSKELFGNTPSTLASDQLGQLITWVKEN